MLEEEEEEKASSNNPQKGRGERRVSDNNISPKNHHN